MINSVIDQLSDCFTPKIFSTDFSLIVEDYIYEACHKFLFCPTDDDEMKNSQIREKITILQNHIKPDMLSIDASRANMQLITAAIHGIFIRNTKNKRIQESCSKNSNP